MKAGQVFERSRISEDIHELKLELLKQKIESKLEMLFRIYFETNGNGEFPERLRLKEIVEHAFLLDENIKEQILGLNQIYLDLISNGTGSSYFVHILDTYGHIVGM